MEALPQDTFLLTALVFALGLKHGFDADHLSTIDGLIRYNSRANPRWARYCGVLFSLGHGGVVIAVAAVASLMARSWAVPGWMEGFGTLISVFFLALLGLANLSAVLLTPPGQRVRVVGVKGRWLGSLRRAGRPSLVALVGALFALSFDTLGQATVFALGTGSPGDWPRAAGLGLVFMLGMLTTDGINGLWIWRLLRRADRTGRIASRIMGLAVAVLSLAVAALGVAKYVSPQVGAWMEGSELSMGLGVIGVLCAVFAVAWVFARARLGKAA